MLLVNIMDMIGKLCNDQKEIKLDKTEMVKLEVSEIIDRGELFGGLDKNLKIVENDFNVDIIQRDNELIIKGQHPHQAQHVLREMMNVLEKGEKLDEQKINYIADLSEKGISYKEQNVSRDIICFTHEGKPLRPKTIGQKGYVDTIRKKDIVFGMKFHIPKQ